MAGQNRRGGVCGYWSRPFHQYRVKGGGQAGNDGGDFRPLFRGQGRRIRIRRRIPRLGQGRRDSGRRQQFGHKGHIRIVFRRGGQGFVPSGGWAGRRKTGQQSSGQASFAGAGTISDNLQYGQRCLRKGNGAASPVRLLCGHCYRAIAGIVGLL